MYGLAVGLKHHQIQPLGWCGRAGSLAAGLGAPVQQLRSSWEMCDMRPWHWSSCQPKSSVLPGAFVCALNPPSVLGALFSPGGQPRAAMYGFTFAVRGYLCCRKLLNNSVNMNEHVSLITSSEKSHIFLFFNEQFLLVNVSDLKHMFLLLGDSAVIPFLYLICGGRAWSCAGSSPRYTGNCMGS